ncbi:hypothetical protein B0H63DRAFT_400999 [Podospora didyma]|uniref:Cell cycle control protein n=1 Tax=Podospora didyma TaxID=330526 RepID=A0AAE0N8F5_9PEZI|nr:hypothetical protein B0H63DRAFT_400999 [Podospora didyma]
MEVAAPVPARRQNANANRANSGNIIDLTGDPSDASDEILILPPNHTHNHNRASNRRSIPPPLSRNPRRQMSLNHRTPSLARSDGSLLGPAAPVIDLTMDDEDSDGPPRPLNLPNQQRHPARAQGRARSGPPPRAPPRSAAAAHNAQIIGGDPEFGALIGIVRNLGQNFQRFRDFGAIGNFPFFGGQGLEPVGNNARAPFMNNPLGENLPRFNYGANGYNSGGLAKPRHEPPKPAREGFSRATGAELDYVCPSCDEELKYDPDADDANAPPAKKARTRKDREEHHFWAVKECGHVYCRSCYENRKPSAKSPTKTTFRVSPQHPKKLLCAVDDCESDVTTKAAWVGLFV